MINWKSYLEIIDRAHRQQPPDYTVHHYPSTFNENGEELLNMGSHKNPHWVPRSEAEAKINAEDWTTKWMRDLKDEEKRNAESADRWYQEMQATGRYTGNYAEPETSTEKRSHNRTFEPVDMPPSTIERIVTFIFVAILFIVLGILPLIVAIRSQP